MKFFKSLGGNRYERLYPRRQVNAELFDIEDRASLIRLVRKFFLFVLAFNIALFITIVVVQLALLIV